MMTPALAYHFTDGCTLRDGRPVPPIGEALVHDGPLKLCASGLHGSLHAFDALRYAPGSILHRTMHGGQIIYGTDKLVSTERTRLATIDATDLMRSFARQSAMDVIHLWDAPEVVKEYLETGDESLREAALAAAGAARAARAAGAARDAAWDAAGAAQAAAQDAARKAAGVAAGAAVWAAARNAARNAAWDAAWDMAGDVLLATQRDRFARMVNEAFGDVS